MSQASSLVTIKSTVSSAISITFPQSLWHFGAHRSPVVSRSSRAATIAPGAARHGRVTVAAAGVGRPFHPHEGVHVRAQDGEVHRPEQGGPAGQVLHALN